METREAHRKMGKRNGWEEVTQNPTDVFRHKEGKAKERKLQNPKPNETSIDRA